MNYSALLNAHDIRPTANRIVIVKALASAMRPMSLIELEHAIGTIDKSNELCHSNDHDHDNDQHPHFHCEQCRRTFCLDNTEIPPIPIPEGYEMHTANYIVRGICPECSRKKK